MLGAVCIIAVLWGTAAGSVIGRKVPHPPRKVFRFQATLSVCVVVPRSMRGRCLCESSSGSRRAFL